MSDYGVTPTGVVIKRLDTIMNEIHDDLSEGWGVNTRLNPKSYLNVQVTAFADKLAELWEYGEQIYHSMYPFSAEGASLDNAIQYGGVAREDARPTYYPIHAECVDGTVIPKGTRIKTHTNPAIEFVASADTTVTRNAFSFAKIRISVVIPSEIYTIALDGELFSYTSNAAATEQEILTGLEAAITNTAFIVSVEGNLLYIESADLLRTHLMVLGGNLTTESVTGIVHYASDFNGDIFLPSGIITQIVTSVPGLLSVTNLIPRIAGRLLQSDIDVRQAYADKIFIRSNRMLESIKSAVLRNVQGVVSVAGYQNDTHVVDADGRWPHCIEMVIEGGNDYELAMQIWDRKAAGIQTFGSTEVTIPGEEGEPVTIRFNRPAYVYVWFRVMITMSKLRPLPPNYVDATKEIIMNRMARIEPGISIVPQTFLRDIYEQIPGIALIEIPTYYTADPSIIPPPSAFIEQEVTITTRQRAVTEETRIEVLLSG
ncbi:MAG: hypothetical protein LBS84_03230 [Clostridiales bacterium]|jgi:hypothetical protein|nr:hypothetical protein [Clostridiales bacterium]